MSARRDTRPRKPRKDPLCACCGVTSDLQLVAVVPRRTPSSPVENITLCQPCITRPDRAWRWRWRPVEQPEAAA